MITTTGSKKSYRNKTITAADRADRTMTTEAIKQDLNWDLSYTYEDDYSSDQTK